MKQFSIDTEFSPIASLWTNDEEKIAIWSQAGIAIWDVMNEERLYVTGSSWTGYYYFAQFGAFLQNILPSTEAVQDSVPLFWIRKRWLKSNELTAGVMDTTGLLMKVF